MNPFTRIDLSYAPPPGFTHIDLLRAEALFLFYSSPPPVRLDFLYVLTHQGDFYTDQLLSTCAYHATRISLFFSPASQTRRAFHTHRRVVRLTY